MAIIKYLENFTVDIEERKILRFLGLKKKNPEIADSLKKIIEEERQRLPYLLTAKAVYGLFEYGETDGHPIFQNALKVVLCICTIGPKLEEESARLIRENEILRGLVLDAFGSEAAEEVAKQAYSFIAQEARSMNLWPTKRFSPGYGKWELQAQRFIFQVLPAAKIGVRLNESCMMIPRKSISFRVNFLGHQPKKIFS